MLTERLEHGHGWQPGRTLLGLARRCERATIAYGEALRKSSCARPGPARSRPAAGSPARDSLRQRRRAPAAGAGGAARRRALCAHFAGLFARVDRFHRAQARRRLLSPGFVFVSDRGSLRASAGGGGRARRRGRIDRARGRDAWSVAPGSGAPTVDRDVTLALLRDDIAKILFTSGSTGSPKGVINTHRMLCSNQQMILQTLPFLGDAPPVLVDWLPWHHTFGGNHNIGIVVYNGGSLYLDEGRPMPGAFDESVRNLREVVPTILSQRPERLRRARAGARDVTARSRRSSSTVCRCCSMPPPVCRSHVSDELERLALETCGERLVLVTGLGATETAPMAICRPWASEVSSAIGLPVPGVEAKLDRRWRKSWRCASAART